MGFTYNLPSHIQLLPMEQGSQEWLDFKDGYIGGTDIAPILGESIRKSRLRLFLEKTGAWPRKNLSDNEFVFWGNVEEAPILNMLQYMDVNGEYMTHYLAKSKQKKLDTNPGILLNSKYPWMMGSLDSIEHNGVTKDFKPIQYKYIDAKNTTSMALNSYVDGSPREYICQNHGYMTLGEWDYSEIAFKIDGNKLRIYEVPFNKELSEMIIASTYSFHLNILKYKKTHLEMLQHIENFDMFKAEQAKAELDNMEPEPDSTEDYESFMKERYRDVTTKERLATPEEVEFAHQYKIASSIEGVCKAEKQLLKNTLLKILCTEKLQKIKLSPKGSVTTSNGSMRVNLTDTDRQFEAKEIAKEILNTLKSK
jgi:predicted phage-related endonuclease